MWPNPQKDADLVTFAEEILNGKLHFLAVLMILNHVEQGHAVNFMKCLASLVSFIFLPKI